MKRALYPTDLLQFFQMSTQGKDLPGGFDVFYQPLSEEPLQKRNRLMHAVRKLAKLKILTAGSCSSLKPSHRPHYFYHLSLFLKLNVRLLDLLAFNSVCTMHCIFSLFFLS